MPLRRYTAEQNAELERLAAAGKTALQIADVLDRSVSSVRQRVLRMGMELDRSGRPVTLGELRIARRMSDCRLTAAMIGKVLKRPASSVDGIRHRHDIHPPPVHGRLEVCLSERALAALWVAAREWHTRPGRVAAAVLEVTTADQLDLLPHVLPPPPAPASVPLASLVFVQLSARMG